MWMHINSKLVHPNNGNVAGACFVGEVWAEHQGFTWPCQRKHISQCHAQVARVGSLARVSRTTCTVCLEGKPCMLDRLRCPGYSE